MRKFTEPTCKNLLRRPLVLGVPFIGLIGLSLLVLGIQTLGQGNKATNLIAFGAAIIGYISLRIITRFSRPGWEESARFWLEKRFSKAGEMEILSSSETLCSPDTLDETAILQSKQGLEGRVRLLKEHERLTLMFEMTSNGTNVSEIRINKYGLCATDYKFVYSLTALPVVTDPLWLPVQLERLGADLQVIVSVRGLDPHASRSQIDAARKRNARTTGLLEIDNEVSFEESTRILQGLSRGDEWIVELALVVISDKSLNLDPHYFHLEKHIELPILSALGLRERFHRSHWMRAVTATDLMPTLLDPHEDGAVAVLKSLRGKTLWFDPQDPRLEALHWLVIGASGVGKSFFTALLLWRMVEQKTPMSVFFIDHHRSFRRFLRKAGVYFEPQDHAELIGRIPLILTCLNCLSGMVGVELSDLTSTEKKASVRHLLEEVERYLKTRKTSHPVYIVMDECWNFLRDEPELIQRFFREFRKLNGAAVAITQSLSDFLTDESGRSIFQNAPIRILLRQGEDLSSYRGVLGLNDVELERLRMLRQKKGIFSECLIKTPFTSRIARLYPTEEEHELLRTDTIRQEMFCEQKEGTC